MKTMFLILYFLTGNACKLAIPSDTHIDLSSFKDIHHYAIYYDENLIIGDFNVKYEAIRGLPISKTEKAKGVFFCAKEI